mmetsp:Transcript_35124/g.65078  ORF Transcript_35124/g.65078 Transcript_35124/m.65078 type:complete len:100 (+) Transcript_35124:1447-1746(+)
MKKVRAIPDRIQTIQKRLEEIELEKQKAFEEQQTRKARNMRLEKDIFYLQEKFNADSAAVTKMNEDFRDLGVKHDSLMKQKEAQLKLLIKTADDVRTST